MFAMAKMTQFFGGILKKRNQHNTWLLAILWWGSRKEGAKMSRLRTLQKESKVALPNSGETYVSEDGTMSMVLDDAYNPNYEPTDTELKEYAEWLGMVFPEDEPLLWLAREGLKAPLPKEWKPCKTDSGEVYYFNFKTGDSIWDHPMDEHFKKKFQQEKDRLKKEKAGISTAPKALDTKAVARTIIADPLPKTKEADPAPEKKALPSSLPSAAAASAIPTKRDDSFTPTDRAITPTKAEPASRVKEDAPMRASATISSESTAKADTALRQPINKNGATPSLGSEKDAPQQLPSALSLTATRFLTEADKQRQEKVRKELEAEHRVLVAELEDEFTAQLTRRKAHHTSECSAIRERAAAKKKRQLELAESELQEELERKQRNAELRTRRETNKMETEIDEYRDKLKEFQSRENDRKSKAEDEITAKAAAALRRAISSMEEEAEKERSNSKNVPEMLAAQRKLCEERMNSSVADSRKRVREDYERYCASRRLEQSALIAQLRTDAEHQVAQEKARCVAEAEARSKMAEQSKMDAQRTYETAQLKSLSELEASNRQLEAAAAAQCEQASRGATEREKEAIRQNSESAKRQIEAVKRSQREALIRGLENERKRRLDAVRTVNGATTTSEIEENRADLTERRRERDALSEKLEEAKKQAASAAEKEFSKYVEEQTSKAKADFEKWVQEQTDIRQKAASNLVTEPVRVPSIGSPSEALRKLRAQQEEGYASAAKKLRESHSTAATKAVMALAEELASVEQNERRKVDDELAALLTADLEQRQRETELPVDMGAAIAALRAEFAAKETELRRQYHARVKAQEDQERLQQLQRQQQPNSPEQRDDDVDASAHARAALQKDPMEYVATQQKERDQRRAALAAARAEWNKGVQEAQAGMPEGVVDVLPGKQQASSNTRTKKTRDNHAEGEKVHVSSPPVGGRQAEDAVTKEDLAKVLMALDGKLELLSKKVAQIAQQNTPNASPPDASHRHRHDDKEAKKGLRASQPCPASHRPDPKEGRERHSHDTALIRKWLDVLCSISSGKASH